MEKIVYHSAKFCEECDHELTESEYAYSNGLCPHCGNQNEGTFINVNKKVYRFGTRQSGKWYWPFPVRYRIWKAEEDAIINGLKGKKPSQTSLRRLGENYDSNYRNEEGDWS